MQSSGSRTERVQQVLPVCGNVMSAELALKVSEGRMNYLMNGVGVILTPQDFKIINLCFSKSLVWGLPWWRSG